MPDFTAQKARPEQFPGARQLQRQAREAEAGAVRDEFDFLPGVLGDAVFLLDRLPAAARGIFLETTKESGNPLTGFTRGLLGQDGYHFDTYYGRNLTSFLPEVFLDPTLFIGGVGLTSKAVKSAGGVAKFTRVTPDLIRGGQASGIPLLGRLGVNPFKPGSSGVAISEALEKAGQVTGFSGFKRLGEIEAAAEASLFAGAGKLRTALGFQTTLGEKLKILQASGSALVTHLGNVSNGNLASVKSLGSDLAQIVDANSASGQVRQFLQPFMSEFAESDVAASNAAALINDAIEGFSKNTRVFGEEPSREALSRFVVDVLESARRGEDASKKVISTDPRLGEFARLIQGTLDYVVDLEIANSIPSSRLGFKAAERLDTLKGQIPALRNAERALSDLGVVFGASDVPRVRATGDEVASILEAQSPFLTKGQVRSLQRFFMGHNRSVEEIHRKFLDIHSRTNAAIRATQTHVDQTPGYMQFAMSEAGKRHLGIGKKTRLGTFINVTNENAIKRKHVWTRSLAKQMEGQFQPKSPGVPMTHREVNFAYRNGYFKRSNRFIAQAKRQGKKLSPAELGEKIDFDVFPSDVISLTQQRLTSSGRLVTSSKILQAAAKKFGKEALTVEGSDLLTAKGFRKAKFPHFSPLANTYFPDAVATELERFVPMLSNPNELGFLGQSMRYITNLWRDMTLFPIWRVFGFASRNYMTDIMFNWTSGMGAARSKEVFEAYTAAARAMSPGDGTFWRRASKKANGELSSTRVGFFDNVETVQRELRSMREMIGEADPSTIMNKLSWEHPTLGMINADDFLRNAKKLNVENSGFLGEAATYDGLFRDIAKESVRESRRGSLGNHVSKVNEVMGKAASVGKFVTGVGKNTINKKFARMLENHARLSHFWFEMFKNGRSWDEAADIVTSAHPTSKLSSRGEAALKQLFPFYSWLSFNLPKQLDLFVNRPSLFGRWSRAAGWWMRGVGVEDDDFPTWMQDRGGLPTKRFIDENTGEEYYGVVWAGSVIPFVDLINIGSGDQMWNLMVDNFNAPVKAVLEAGVLNYDLSLRRPIKEKTAGFFGGDFIVPDIGVRGESIDHMLRAWPIYNLTDRLLGGFATPEAEARASRTQGDILKSAVLPISQSRVQVGRGSMSRHLMFEMMVSEVRSKLKRDLRDLNLTDSAKQKALARAEKNLERLISDFEAGTLRRRKLPVFAQ